jgi:hypothetical protein
MQILDEFVDKKKKTFMSEVVKYSNSTQPSVAVPLKAFNSIPDGLAHSKP